MPVASALEGKPEWTPLLEAVAKSGKALATNDLAAARASFVPFSVAAASVARQARKHPEFADLKIYECAMVSGAVPGAPKKAAWLQLTAPMRNPFFGSRMLDCGIEVKE
jgi:hypothetical protein